MLIYGCISFSIISFRPPVPLGFCVSFLWDMTGICAAGWTFQHDTLGRLPSTCMLVGLFWDVYLSHSSTDPTRQQTATTTTTTTAAAAATSSSTTAASATAGARIQCSRISTSSCPLSSSAPPPSPPGPSTVSALHASSSGLPRPVWPAQVSSLSRHRLSFLPIFGLSLSVLNLRLDSLHAYSSFSPPSHLPSPLTSSPISHLPSPISRPASHHHHVLTSACLLPFFHPPRFYLDSLSFFLSCLFTCACAHHHFIASSVQPQTIRRPSSVRPPFAAASPITSAYCDPT